MFVLNFADGNRETELSEVNKKKGMDVLLIQTKSRKYIAKTKPIRLGHELERLCIKDSELTIMESVIEQLIEP